MKIFSLPFRQIPGLDLQASFILVKNDNEIIKPEALSTPCAAMTSDMVPRASASDGLTPKVGQRQQNILESTGNNSSKSGEAVQASEDILLEIPQDLLMAHNVRSHDNELNELNLKQEDFADRSSTGNPFRASVIPEQTYIWQYVISPSPLNTLTQL